MRIPNELLESVAFVGSRKREKLLFSGTGFFVQVGVQERAVFYFVTARHTLDGFQQQGLPLCVRTNLGDGGIQWFETEVEDWIRHPDNSVDVAAINMSEWVNKHMDGDITIDVSACYLGAESPSRVVLTEDVMQEERIGPGDDVLTVSLLYWLPGTKKNVPIVRSGTLAMVPAQFVPTSESDSEEVYLIETRSIGGVSGAPAFMFIPNPISLINDSALRSSVAGGKYFLLGVVAGHWELPPGISINETTPANSVLHGVNLGLARVTPATKLCDILFAPDEIRRRDIWHKLRGIN